LPELDYWTSVDYLQSRTVELLVNMMWLTYGDDRIPLLTLCTDSMLDKVPWDHWSSFHWMSSH
jgi:hypothetical protein